MQRGLLNILGFVFLGLWLSASMCTKVVVYGKDQNTTPISKTYKSNLRITMLQAENAIKSLGYEIKHFDHHQHRIVTGWRTVFSDSHYKYQFKRRDYSANQGAYYQLRVDVVEDGNLIKVSASTNIKSLIGDLKSAYVVENRFLERLSEFMRSPQIEMTNVGVTDR